MVKNRRKKEREGKRNQGRPTIPLSLPKLQENLLPYPRPLTSLLELFSLGKKKKN